MTATIPEIGAPPTPRRRLLRALGRFFLIHAAVLAAIGMIYLSTWGWPGGTLAAVYAVAAFAGHFFALAFVPWLVLAPLALLVKSPRLVLSGAAVLAALTAALLLVDALLYSELRLHVNGIVAEIGAHTWVFGAVYLFIGLAFYGMLARSCWQRFAVPRAKKGRGLAVAGALFCALLVSQLVHVWADASYYAPVTSFTHCLPMYRPLKAKSLLVDSGWIDVAAARDRNLVSQLGAHDDDGLLSYPLAPLAFDPAVVPAAAPKNVLVILVDALRRDVVDAETAPVLSGFAERAIDFRHHFSGGNSSQAGMFSLFYGVAATYFDVFHGHQRPPVLITSLQQQGYELGLFCSARIYHPANLDRTAFASVLSRDIFVADEDLGSCAKDETITRECVDWLAQRDRSKPFFGFLLYDAVVSRKSPKELRDLFDVKDGFTGDQEKFAKYRRAVRFVDGCIGRVLDALEADGLLDSTIVLVTADHGEEFDETGLGYQKHGSAFSRAQLHTPMIVHWPGREPGPVPRRTSHYDVVPTLLSRVLGCTSPFADYSSGGDLFDDGAGAGWEWMIAASYYNFAIVQPDQVTVTYPGGYSEVRDPDFRPLEGEHRENEEVLERALQEMARFVAR